MTATAMKSRTKKVAEHYPPKTLGVKQYAWSSPEIPTKVRQAWIAAKVAELNALPGRSAKAVGGGSYQKVVEYETIESEGRLRHRGTCQACGAAQVITPAGIVLHGYKRPGDGMIWGRCVGVNNPAAEKSVDVCVRLIGTLRKTADEIEKGMKGEVEPSYSSSYRTKGPRTPYEVYRDKLASIAANRQHATFLNEVVVPKYGSPLTPEVV